MYSLGHVEGFGGFTTGDAQPGGFWHDELDTPHIEPAEEVSFGATQRQQSGTVHLGAGGAAYIEFTGPADLIGQLTVTVGEGAAATLISGVADFPTVCPKYIGPTRSAASCASAAENTAPLGPEEEFGCGNPVLVITNTALPLPRLYKPSTGARTVSWTARFVPDMVMLQNDSLTLGVGNTGVLGYSGGIQREGTYHVSLNDGWAVRDDEVTGQDFDYHGERTVEPGLFTFNPERSTAYTGSSVGPVNPFDGAGLVVRQRVHPSQDPNLYAVDVTVERPEPLLPQTPSAGGHVYYRRSTSWDVTWSRYVWEMESTWAKSPGGDDSRVITVTDDATWYVQPVAPWGTAGYATSGPHWEAGSTLDLDLGVIAPGDSVSFTLYYGVALTKADAEAAVAAVDADVFYLATPAWPGPDQSATGIFAYRATTPTSGVTP